MEWIPRICEWQIVFTPPGHGSSICDTMLSQFKKSFVKQTIHTPTEFLQLAMRKNNGENGLQCIPTRFVLNFKCKFGKLHKTLCKIGEIERAASWKITRNHENTGFGIFMKMSHLEVAWKKVSDVLHEQIPDPTLPGEIRPENSTCALALLKEIQSKAVEASQMFSNEQVNDWKEYCKKGKNWIGNRVSLSHSDMITVFQRINEKIGGRIVGNMPPQNIIKYLDRKNKNLNANQLDQQEKEEEKIPRDMEIEEMNPEEQQQEKEKLKVEQHKQPQEMDVEKVDDVQEQPHELDVETIDQEERDEEEMVMQDEKQESDDDCFYV